MNFELEKLKEAQRFGKNSVSVFLGRNVTDFNLPECKLEHEVEDNMPTATRIFPLTLSSQRVRTSGLNFGHNCVKFDYQSSTKFEERRI